MDRHLSQIWDTLNKCFKSNLANMAKANSSQLKRDQKKQVFGHISALRALSEKI